MRGEYDFSDGVKGHHAARYAQGVEIAVDGQPKEEAIVLDADVRRFFSTSKSVNEALRMLMQTAKRAQALKKAS